MTLTVDTEEMPCGRTCQSCPAAILCHDSDPDGPDFDPAEIAYYLELEEES